FRDDFSYVKIGIEENCGHRTTTGEEERRASSPARWEVEGMSRGYGANSSTVISTRAGERAGFDFFVAERANARYDLCSFRLSSFSVSNRATELHETCSQGAQEEADNLRACVIFRRSRERADFICESECLSTFQKYMQNIQVIMLYMFLLCPPLIVDEIDLPCYDLPNNAKIKICGLQTPENCCRIVNAALHDFTYLVDGIKLILLVVMLLLLLLLIVDSQVERILDMIHAYLKLYVMLLTSIINLAYLIDGIKLILLVVMLLLLLLMIVDAQPELSNVRPRTRIVAGVKGAAPLAGVSGGGAEFASGFARCRRFWADTGRCWFRCAAFGLSNSSYASSHFSLNLNEAACS
ncbi:hypothetical protein Taro_012747, partial [Colocasia esculenta]|nr:hypothetical protein [Colocasia esculenta]